MANQVLYGFVNLQNVFGQRIDQVGVRVIADAIQATVDEHNRQMEALLGLFVRRTTDFKTRFKSPALARLQPLDEQGRAVPIRAAGYYDVSFPLQKAGAAWGATYEARVKMTVEDANNITATMLMADSRWVRDHILAALFTNASWTFTDDEHGALTIKGLANGDTDSYLVMAGSDAGATDTHYLAQAAAVADASNPFPTIYDELKTHPENSGEVVALIATAQRTAVEGLATFRPIQDPNVRPADTATVLTGNLGQRVPGTVIGYADKVWIAEWPSLPDDYIIATTTGGERALAMREHPEAELQGFKQVATRDDHPFYERQWQRIAGFGGWNRVNAVVQRVGNGAYAIPTNYTTPMP
jgi:hypothetical protein